MSQYFMMINYDRIVGLKYVAQKYKTMRPYQYFHCISVIQILGISRSFTRKLHEWEKSRGIAPECSTSALLRAARARNSKVPQAPLTRTQSDGSVAPSAAGSNSRLHASSLSVNDADDFDSEYEREEHSVSMISLCNNNMYDNRLTIHCLD